MNRPTLASLLLSAAALCGADQPKPPAESISESSGINLRFDSAKPTFGEPEGPAFSVHAATGTQTADLGVWALDNAHATIYRRPEENLLLVSRSMIFDLDNKAASLSGGVRLTSGRLIVDVEDMSWDDTTRIARSESVATLDDGANQITGESIAIYPDTDQLELGSGSALIQLAAAVEQKPAAEAPKPKSESRFKSISVKPFKGITANLDGQVRDIKGPAHLTLVGKAPADTMDVDADTVTFTYASTEDASLTGIGFKGHVKFNHSQGTFHADQADVDLAVGKVRFAGNVTIESPQIRGAKTQSFELDLNTSEFVMGPGEIESLSLVPAEKPAPKP